MWRELGNRLECSREWLVPQQRDKPESPFGKVALSLRGCDFFEGLTLGKEIWGR